MVSFATYVYLAISLLSNSSCNASNQSSTGNSASLSFIPGANTHWALKHTATVFISPDTYNFIPQLSFFLLFTHNTDNSFQYPCFFPCRISIVDLKFLALRYIKFFQEVARFLHIGQRLPK